MNHYVPVTDMIQSVIAQAVYLDPNHRQGIEQSKHLGTQGTSNKFSV